MRRALTDEQRALCADPAAVAAVGYHARRYARRAPGLADEVWSAAWFGLVEAAGRYDATRGVEFATFAAARAAGSIRDALRLLTPQGFRRRGDRPPVESLSCQPAPEADLVYADELPVGWELEATDAVEAMCRLLPAAERAALVAYYTRAGATLRQIGAAAGRKEAWASIVTSGGLRMLREAAGVTADGGVREMTGRRKRERVRYGIARGACPVK